MSAEYLVVPGVDLGYVNSSSRQVGDPERLTRFLNEFGGKGWNLDRILTAETLKELGLVLPAGNYWVVFSKNSG